LSKRASQPSAVEVGIGDKCRFGLSFSTIGPYIRLVGLTDYGDKQAMK